MLTSYTVIELALGTYSTYQSTNHKEKHPTLRRHPGPDGRPPTGRPLHQRVLCPLPRRALPHRVQRRRPAVHCLRPGEAQLPEGPVQLHRVVRVQRDGQRTHHM